MDRFETFTSSILKLNRYIQKIKAIEMKEYDLRGTSIMCLYHLLKEDNLASKDLARLCVEDKAQISRALVILENKGYIRYAQDTKKKYKTAILLTDEGKVVASEVNNKVNKIFDTCGKVLNEEERVIFYDLLTKISNELEKFINDSSK